MARPKLSEAEKAKREAERQAEAERIKSMSPEEKKAYYATQRVENFKRVAVRRTNRVLEDMHSLARVGNRQIYSYTEEEAAKIVNAISDAFDNLVHSFQPKSAEDRQSFTL